MPNFPPRTRRQRVIDPTAETGENPYGWANADIAAAVAAMAGGGGPVVVDSDAGSTIAGAGSIEVLSSLTIPGGTLSAGSRLRLAYSGKFQGFNDETTVITVDGTTVVTNGLYNYTGYTTIYLGSLDLYCDGTSIHATSFVSPDPGGYVSTPSVAVTVASDIVIEVKALVPSGNTHFMGPSYVEVW